MRKHVQISLENLGQTRTHRFQKEEEEKVKRSTTGHYEPLHKFFNYQLIYKQKISLECNKYKFFKNSVIYKKRSLKYIKLLKKSFAPPYYLF